MSTTGPGLLGWTAMFAIGCGASTPGNPGDSNTEKALVASASRSPLAEDDAYRVEKRRPSLSVRAADGVLANDHDPDAGALTVTSAPTQSKDGGALHVQTDGSFTYAPPLPPYFGVDTFEYTVRDSAGHSSTASVRIGVLPQRIELADVAAGTHGFAINPQHPSSYLRVTPAADMNGDGRDELLVGAPGVGTAPGNAFIVWGKTDRDPVELARAAQGSGGFEIRGTTGNASMGEALRAAGDLDGDGTPDVVVGAARSDTTRDDEGEAFVIFGKAGGAPVDVSKLRAAASGGFAIQGEETGWQLGGSVTGIGDMNGDGLSEVAVASGAAAAPNDEAGRVYVVFGRHKSAPVATKDVGSSVPGFMINGVAARYQVGPVSDAGDVDGDGRSDIVIGASELGHAYVVFGKSDGVPVELAEVATGHGGGFLIETTAEGAPADRLGSSVAGIGDMNGDGLADVAVGAKQDQFVGDDGGRVYIVWGKADSKTVKVTDVEHGDGGFSIHGEDGGDQAYVTGPAGDFNADGITDVMVGAVKGGSRSDTVPLAGRAYLVYGKRDGTVVELANVARGDGGFVLVGEDPGSGAGSDVNATADINGDGAVDIIVGAAFSSSAKESGGRAYVVFGANFPPAK